jgi:hypothetical protein
MQYSHLQLGLLRQPSPITSLSQLQFVKYSDGCNLHASKKQLATNTKCSCCVIYRLEQGRSKFRRHSRRKAHSTRRLPPRIESEVPSSLCYPRIEPALGWIARLQRIRALRRLGASFCSSHRLAWNKVTCIDSTSRCGEMADAQDLKSWDHKKSCGFKSHHRHQHGLHARPEDDAVERRAAALDTKTLTLPWFA